MPYSSSTGKEECLDFNEKIDIGTILEQNWMLYEFADKFPDGRMIYCFRVDRDIYIFEKNGKRHALLQAHGSSPTACYVEELSRWGAEKVYRVGTCGALQKDIGNGDVIISMAAVRDEGTSIHYIPLDFPAVSDFKSVYNFQRMLMDKDIPTQTGITWTTDGRFTESDEKISRLSELGVKNVDMETSSLLITCHVRKIPGISIGIVTDIPVEDINENFKGRITDLEEIRDILSKRLYDIGSVIIDSL